MTKKATKMPQKQEEETGKTVDAAPQEPPSNQEPSERKKCVECSRLLAMSEYKQFSASGRYTSMCNRCRGVKSRYMRRRRTTLMRKEMQERGEDFDEDGKRIVLEFDEEIRVRKETDKRYSDLGRFFEDLEESAVDDGKLVTMRFESQVDDMPKLLESEEEDAERKKEIISEAKRRMRDSISERLAGKRGYKWGLYRLSASGMSIYMTLYCSEDKTRARASASTGKRAKVTKKTVDCRSQVHVSYNWSTQLLKISYAHVNHLDGDVPPPVKPVPSKKQKKSTPQDSRIELEEVDPTITAIHAQVQAQQQQFLKKILN